MMFDPAIFDYNPYSAGSSGYGSGEDSPSAYNNNDGSYINRSLDLVHAIQHDHTYTSQTTAIFDEGSPRQADLLVNNYFKKEPPPMLYQNHIYASDMSFDHFSEKNFNAVEEDRNDINLENPDSSSATLIQPINQLGSPDINNFNNPNVYNLDIPSVNSPPADDVCNLHNNVGNRQYPNVSADVEMRDLRNSSNELYEDKNEDNQELIGGDSFNKDGEFIEALKLLDGLMPNWIETIKDILSFKVYELQVRRYLPGKTVLEFEPKLRDFRASDIKVHDPSAYRLICDSETRQLMYSCIHENMKLMENGHLSVTLKYKELVE